MIFDYIETRTNVAWRNVVRTHVPKTLAILYRWTKGSNPNVKCPKNMEKVQKGGGRSPLQIRKSTIQNVDYFEVHTWLIYD